MSFVLSVAFPPFIAIIGRSPSKLSLGPLKDSSLPAGLLLVDALPFLPAVQNPAATVETVQPGAASMRKAMLSQTPEAYQQAARASVAGMSRDLSRTETLESWSAASDPETTAQSLYELMTNDLRPRVAEIRLPVTVIGAWVTYKKYGATRESTQRVFEQQFSQLAGARIVMSDVAHHFIMWDDPELVHKELVAMLAAVSTGQTRARGDSHP